MSRVIDVSDLQANKFYVDSDISNITFGSKIALRFKYKCMMRTPGGYLFYITDSGCLSMILQGYYDAQEEIHDFDVSDIESSSDLIISESGYIYDGEYTIFMVHALIASELRFINKTNIIIPVNSETEKIDIGADVYRILDIDSSILLQSFG